MGTTIRSISRVTVNIPQIIARVTDALLHSAGRVTTRHLGGERAVLGSQRTANRFAESECAKASRRKGILSQSHFNVLNVVLLTVGGVMHWLPPNLLVLHQVSGPPPYLPSGTPYAISAT